MRGVGERLRKRYPSWFRYTIHNDRTDAPALSYLSRINPSSDGTHDAPIDARANRLFWVVAVIAAVVGAVLLALVIIGG
jgi:hypothetical protein